jgi:outer membrane protein
MKRIAAVVAGLLITVASAWAQTTEAVRRISLDEAVGLALQNQPAMVEARGARRNASAADRSAWGAFLPNVTTSASASRGNVRRVDPITGREIPPEYSYTLGVSANLELFDGFRRFANKKAASASLDAAEAGLTLARYEVTLATKQAFYDAAARDELVRVAQAQLERAERQLTVSIDRLHAGTATRSDSLRAVVERGNAQIALLQAEADLEGSRAELGRQVGVDGPVAAFPDSVLLPPPGTETFANEILGSPEVAQAEAEAEAARAGVWSARSQYWPSLNVSYSDNHQGTGSPFSNFGDYEESFSWRFGLSWTLWNGFVREGNQVRVAAARDAAQARAAEARRRVAARLTQQSASLETAYAQVDIARTNVLAAAEDLRVQNERYRLGASTILDLMTSQAALTEAEVGYIQARFQYLLARAELEALIGRAL